jgi:pimeloyl-ACP methyl ester carboxylesterase
MTGIIQFREANLRFRDEGKGDVVVLLHGYLESLDIWGSFAEELAMHYRVISIDLPGHGQSGEYTRFDTMAVMADAVKHVLDHLNIGRCVIIGHSMGGYATLAFAEIYPELLVGYCLLHSHALADSEEKKKDRDREIELVRSGKKMQFIDVNIPKAFADDNLKKFADEVEKAGKIAAATSDHGIICALEGMKSKPDRRKILKGSNVPVLIIAGKKDNYIPFEICEQHFDLAPHGQVLVLENSGHMGFIEEKDKTLDGILKFLKKIY